MQRSLWIAALLLPVALTARTTGRDQNEPSSFSDIADHFKYGSVGTEERAGVPYWIWRVLPIVFADKLPTRPGKGYERLGFINDGAAHGRPIGTSFFAGRVDTVGLNCATCHAGTIRETPTSPRRVVLGMPANQMDLQGYSRFLTACANDSRFNASTLIEAIEKENPDFGFFESRSIDSSWSSARVTASSKTGKPPPGSMPGRRSVRDASIRSTPTRCCSRSA